MESERYLSRAGCWRKSPVDFFFREQSIGGSRSVFVRLETGVLACWAYGGGGGGVIEMKLGWFRVDLDEGQVR